MSTIRNSNINTFYHILIVLFRRGILNLYSTSSRNLYIIAQNEIIAQNIFNTANIIPFVTTENSCFSDLFDEIIGYILKYNLQLEELLDGYIIELTNLSNLTNLENIFERIVL